MKEEYLVLISKDKYYVCETRELAEQCADENQIDYNFIIKITTNYD